MLVKRKCEFCGFYDKKENLEHELSQYYSVDGSHIKWYHPECLWFVIKEGEQHPLINKALHIFSLMKKRNEQEALYKEERRKTLEEAKRYLYKKECIDEHPEHLLLEKLKKSIDSIKKDVDFLCKWIKSGDEYKEWIAEGNREEDL